MPIEWARKWGFAQFRVPLHAALPALCTSKRRRALAQAAEVRLIWPARLQVQIEKPTEQQAVIELLAKQLVRAHRVKGNQQLGREQALRRNRRAPVLA